LFFSATIWITGEGKPAETTNVLSLFFRTRDLMLKQSQGRVREVAIAGVLPSRIRWWAGCYTVKPAIALQNPDLWTKLAVAGTTASGRALTGQRCE